MDQLRWMLSFIPDEYLMMLCALIVAVGFVLYFSAFFLKWIPGLTGYTFPLRILGIILTLAGMFAMGGYGVELSWRAEAAKMQKKIDEAAAQSAAANRAISQDVQTQTTVVKEKGDTIIKYIDRWKTNEIKVEGPERVRVEEVIKYIENCPVPKELLDVHNAAARMNQKTDGDKK